METITLLQAVFNLLVALVCAIIIYTVYYFTSKDVKPSASFAKTLLIVTMATSLVIMLIGSNLALSLGMVGALSVIRFRAAVKDSRDAAFIFFAIAAGMTTALGVYSLSFAGTLFISAAIIVFSFINVGSRTYVITVRSSSINTDVEAEIRKVVGKRFSIVAVASKNIQTDINAAERKTQVVETVYELGLKNDAAELCRCLSSLDGVDSVNAVLREEV